MKLAADEIWQDFVARPGATVDGQIGIASHFAIGGLLRIIRRKRPTRILEIGSGIGTLTSTIVRASAELGLDKRNNYEFLTIENEPFCIEQLHNNLADYSNFTHLQSTSEPAASGKPFDLIVIDGGGDLPNDMGVMDFSDRLAHRGTIFIEGLRTFQKDRTLEWYGERPHIHLRLSPPKRTVVATYNQQRAKNKGYHLFLFEPSFAQRVWFSVYGRVNSLSSRIWRRLSSR